MTAAFKIRTIQPADRGAVNDLSVKHWYETRVLSIDGFIESGTLPGFVAVIDNMIVAALTWRIHEANLQIVTLASERQGMGIGSALVDEAENEARRRNVSRVLVSTDNSNIDALRFYQKRGYVLHELHKNAFAQLRKLKPSIPQVDEHGIPIRDQIDLIKELQ